MTISKIGIGYKGSDSDKNEYDSSRSKFSAAELTDRGIDALLKEVGRSYRRSMYSLSERKYEEIKVKIFRKVKEFLHYK